VSAVLQELRARLGVFESHFQKEAFPYPPLPGGLPRGILTEITGRGKTEAVARLLAENAGLRCAWIEDRFSLLPSALAQRGVSLEKVFFVEAGLEAGWAAATVLRAQLFPLVVYRAPYGDVRELRRFQLLAGKGHSTMVLLGDQPAAHAWPIRLSLEAREKGRRLFVTRGR
jgi:hypothetical protein